jgi:hypothetical protein
MPHEGIDLGEIVQAGLAQNEPFGPEFHTHFPRLAQPSHLRRRGAIMFL